MAHLQHHFAGRVGFFREALREAAPHHFGDQFVHIGLRHGERVYPFAIAQNGDFIANFENFFHFVRDINDAAAALFQFFNDFK